LFEIVLRNCFATVFDASHGLVMHRLMRFLGSRAFSGQGSNDLEKHLYAYVNQELLVSTFEQLVGFSSP